MRPIYIASIRLLGLSLVLLSIPIRTDGALVYVANSDSDRVSVINTATNNVVATVPVASSPFGVAITPDGASVYVTHPGSDIVQVINTVTNTVEASMAAGDTPFEVAITPDGGLAFVSNMHMGTFHDPTAEVSVIDTAANTVTATVEGLGPGPNDVAITPDGQFAYVTQDYGSNVYVISTTTYTVVAMVDMGNSTGGVAITPDGAFAYVVTAPYFVSVINTSTNTVATTMQVGGSPIDVAITPDGAFAYVTNTGSGDEVSVISTATNTVVATVPVTDAFRVAITGDGALAYVTSNGTDDVSVISTATNTVVATVPVGGGSRGVAISSEQRRFLDVPTDHWAIDFINKLATSGITAGCGDGIFCPEGPVTRAQMAVFLERGMRGSDYRPPPATGNVFNDVPADHWAAEFIEQFSSDGITSGCGNNNYCPDAEVTRDQMAVFLLRARYGPGHQPPPATGVFDDVPLSYWVAHWIEQLAAEGITSGCGNDNFCPQDPVSRAEMAVFLVRTFGL